MVVGRRLQDSILLSSVFGLGHVTFREFQGAAQYSALTNLQVHAYSFRVARLAFFCSTPYLGGWSCCQAPPFAAFFAGLWAQKWPARREAYEGCWREFGGFKREITQISTWRKPGKNQVADLSYLHIYIYIYLFIYKNNIYIYLRKQASQGFRDDT